MQNDAIRAAHTADRQAAQHDFGPRGIDRNALAPVRNRDAGMHPGWRGD